MATHLIILSETAAEKSVALDVSHKQGKDQEIIDLNSGSPNYDQLVTAIFSADTVHVW